MRAPGILVRLLLGLLAVAAAVIWMLGRPPPGLPETNPPAAAPSPGTAPAGGQSATEKHGLDYVPAPASPYSDAALNDPAIMALLHADKVEEQERALAILRERKDPGLASDLARALEMTRDPARLTLLCRALNGLGTEESVQIFIRFLERPEQALLREHLAPTLLALEQAAPAAQLFEWMMRCKDYDVSLACQAALGRLATPELIDRILVAYRAPERSAFQQQLLRQSLESIEKPACAGILVEIFTDPDFQQDAGLRLALARALARIGTPSALEPLRAALEQSPDGIESNDLVGIMAQATSRESFTYLQNLFATTEDERVRYATGQALARMVPGFELREPDAPPPPAEEASPFPIPSSPPPEIEFQPLPLKVEPEGGSQPQGAPKS